MAPAPSANTFQISVESVQDLRFGPCLSTKHCPTWSFCHGCFGRPGRLRGDPSGPRSGKEARTRKRALPRRVVRRLRDQTVGRRHRASSAAAAGPTRRQRHTAGSLPGPRGRAARRPWRVFRRQGLRRGRPPRRCRATPRRRAHQLVGRESLTQGVGHDGPDPDGHTDQSEGRSRQLPTLGERHDQVTGAGNDGGADEGASTAEAPDHPVRAETPDEVPGGAGGEEDPVGAFADPPFGRGQQHQDSGLHALEAGQGGHHQEQDPQSAVGEEEPDSFPGRGRGAFGLGCLRAEAGKRQTRQHQRNGVGDEGDRLAHGEEPGSDDRAGEVFRPRFRAGEHPVGIFEHVGGHEVGNNGLEGGVVDRTRRPR